MTKFRQAGQLGCSSHRQYRERGRCDGEDIDRIGVTPGLNLHLLWLRGNYICQESFKS